MELSRAPAAIEGPTSYISSTRNSTASGLFKTLARSKASRCEKPPEICAFRESTEFTTGAEYNFPSSTIASGLPTIFSVTARKILEPSPVMTRFTSNEPVVDCAAKASSTISPVASGMRFTKIRRSVISPVMRSSRSSASTS